MKLAPALGAPAILATTLLIAGQAAAQHRAIQPSQPSPPAPSAQQARPGAVESVDPGAVAAWAGRVLAMVDAGQLVPLWDGASAVARKQMKREEFVAAVQAARRPLGAVAGREWSVVRRQRSAGNDSVPVGEYASVETRVQFAGNRPATELVTFRKDEDGTWRFAGYALR